MRPRIPPLGRLVAVVATLAVMAAAAVALAGCGSAVSGGGAAGPMGSATATHSAAATGTRSALPVAKKPAAEATRPVVPTACPSDNATIGWGFTRNTKHTVPDVGSSATKLLAKWGGVYVGDTSRKVIYLTFDEGYENGNTAKILDTLKTKGVKATFFVTGTYCRDAPAMARRIVAEGHLVGNHTWSHPSMPKRAGDADAFAREFSKTEAAFTKATGAKLAPLLRPPGGEYSPRALCMTRNLGYTTVFWSFALADYDEKNQPSIEKTLQMTLGNSHPGAIYLLHAISASDTTALPDIIDGLREQGYEFATLGELPH